MLIIGLTGSIATGKSTASRTLAGPPHSLPVVDADVLAREVVEPGTAGYSAVVARFAETTPDLLQPVSEKMPADGPDGKGRPLDRAALGRRVFGSDAERVRDRAALNGIVHPAVRRAMVRRVLGAYVRGCWAVVLDVPLLFESGLDVFCGVVLLVGMHDQDMQIKRLLQRDRNQGGALTEEDARHRVESQESIASKVARVEARGPKAGATIWNDGAQDELPPKLNAFVADHILAWSPKGWAGLLWACPPLALFSAVWTMYWAGRARKAFEQKKKREAKL